MKRVLINIAGWILIPFLFLWLLCCTGCVYRNMEGDWYAAAPVLDPWDYDPPQVQLNPHTHYYYDP